jgi:hypothetical protein
LLFFFPCFLMINRSCRNAPPDATVFHSLLYLACPGQMLLLLATGHAMPLLVLLNCCWCYSTWLAMCITGAWYMLILLLLLLVHLVFLCTPIACAGML